MIPMEMPSGASESCCNDMIACLADVGMLLEGLQLAQVAAAHGKQKMQNRCGGQLLEVARCIYAYQRFPL